MTRASKIVATPLPTWSAGRPPSRIPAIGKAGESSVAFRDATIYFGVACAIGAYLFRVIGLFDRFPGTMGDARFNQAVLEHLWMWASGRADSLSDPAFFYPYRNMLFFSDTHFGTGMIYALARALGVSREAAFDVWFLAGMATTFAASQYSFRKLGFEPLLAVVGAALFTFAPPMLTHDAHAQLVYRFGVPLAVLALVRFAAAPSLRLASLLTFWTAWQILCSVYIGVFLIELLALMSAVAILRPSVFPRPQKAEPETTNASTAALALLATAFTGAAGYMLLRHAEFAHEYAIRREMQQIVEMAPHWHSLISMQGLPSVAWLTNRLPRFGAYWSFEHQLFPGIGVLILAAAGIKLSRASSSGRRVALTCLVVIAGLILPAMDFGGYGLYQYLTQAPGFNAIRSGGRVVIVMQFPLVWIALLGVAELRRSAAPWTRTALIAGLGMALFDIATFRVSAVDFAKARARVQAVSAGLNPEALQKRHAVLLRFGPQDDQIEKAFDIDLMLAAQDMNLQTLNGFSSSSPPLYKHPADCAEARAMLSRIDALPYKRAGADDIAARAVIVPPGACDAQ